MGGKNKSETEGGGKEVMTTTMVNTDFKMEKPQVLIPLNLARALSLWLPNLLSTPCGLTRHG